MAESKTVDDLVQSVQQGARYREISPDLVRRIADEELSKGRSFKEALKATRSKLHQVGGAYQERGIDYRSWLSELSGLEPSRTNLELMDFCRRMMLQHASTRERIPHLERIFSESLQSIAPIDSILDVACGLNPLTIPWMPLSDHLTYYACDIYQDMIHFLNQYFAFLNIKGEARVCDLIAEIPSQPVQLALILKTLPCLEQMDKSAALRLLEGLQAEHLLVSFPAKSLGGHSKGMVRNYSAHFEELVADKSWKIQRFEYPDELVFLISR